MKSLLLLVCSFLLLGSGARVHDVHISKAEIDYKTEKKMIQISLHIFLDDLEDELKKIGGENLRLCTDKESEDADAYLKNYIKQNFILESNNVDLELEFVGKEVSEDLIAVWIYLMVEDIEPQNLSLDYKVMLSRFDDQKNIVAFKQDGKRKGFYILDHNSHFQKLL